MLTYYLFNIDKIVLLAIKWILNSMLILIISNYLVLNKKYFE